MFSKFSVQKPYTVAVVIIAVLILGYISFTNMTTDLMPSLDLPYVVLSTSYVGASPEEVEMTVTKPLESGLAAVNNIKGVTSVSRENVSMVILEFVDGTNMDAAMIEITTRLDLIKPNWPSGVGAPIILKLNPDMMPVMIAAVDVKGMDPYVLSDYVENKISPKLEAINGVASVAANGLVAQEVTVTISQTRIDEVNTVILKDVDAELAEVEEKINDGERMLRNAKSQLSSQGKKGIQQIDDMLRSISEGKIQIAAAAEQLKLQREALNGQLAEAQAGESALEQALGALPEPMTEEQKVRIAEIREELNNANSEIASLKSKLETVEKQIAEFTQSPENGSSGGVTMEELLAERDQVNEDIARFQEEKDAIETSSEYIKLSALVGADAQRAGLDAQLAATQAGISQMTIGIAQMDTTISNLEKGVVPGGVIPGIDEETNLNEAEQKLTEARGQARSMISSAAGKITEAQRELGEKRKEFEDARDEALKNAKIDGIISVQMISQMLGAENFQMPAGYITENEQDFLVRVGDKFSSLDGVKDMMLFNLNLESIDEVRLTDVAEIAITDNTATTYAKVNGNNGIMLSFQKQSTFSTADVAASLKEQFQKMMDENPDLHIEALFDQGIYINVIVDSVLENLIYGAILAILVLLIFLGDFRPTVVIAFSIPISVVVAFVLMYFTGITLNVISLAGLALAVGMLVDNSIVVIDNIYRLHNDGMPIYKACVYGAKQMSGAILSSTLTTVCVFLPIVFIQGLARQLFADMGLTIAYSLMASLIVALTLVPAMSSALLKRSRPRKHRIFTGLQSAYVKSLRGALKAKWLVLLLTAGVLVWSVMQLASLGTSFMPSVDSKQMTATLKLNPDSVFTERTDLANKVMDTLTTFDDVSTVGVFAGTSGRAGMSALTGSGGSGSSMTFYIVLKDDKSMRNEEIARAMEEKLAPLNCDITFSTSNMDISMLYGEGIQVEVKGRSSTNFGASRPTWRISCAASRVRSM